MPPFPALAAVVLVVAGISACAIAVALGVRLLLPWLSAYAMARPNVRSSHTVPTPQGGGLVVVLVAIAALFAAHRFALTPEGWTIAGCALVLALVGALDDIRPLPVLPRLVAQGLCVWFGVVAMLGAGRLFPALPAVLEYGVLTLAGVWFVNLTNFIDGIDGITAADMVPPSLGALGIWLFLPGLLPLVPADVAILVALGGGMLGFMVWNRHPARVFLGDVGSLPIGFLMGCVLLKIALLTGPDVALVLVLYPVTDATLTLIRRLVRGDKLWEAHREHAYQRALGHGWRVPQVSGLVAGLNVVLVLLALGCLLAGDAVPVRFALVLLALSLVLLVLWRLGKPRKRAL